MITQVVHFLIKVFPDNIVELQEGRGRQVPARLAEAALGDPADAEVFVLRLPEEAIHLSL